MAKGRSKQLVEARDMKMFERYYYWTEIKRLRFDDTITKLSKEEFFISEGRVMQIVRKMIQLGATVDGRRIEKPMFTGFKIPKARKVKVEIPIQQPSEQQLSLFPEFGQ